MVNTVLAHAYHVERRPPNWAYNNASTGKPVTLPALRVRRELVLPPGHGIKAIGRATAPISASGGCTSTAKRHVMQLFGESHGWNNPRQRNVGLSVQTAASRTTRAQLSARRFFSDIKYVWLVSSIGIWADRFIVSRQTGVRTRMAAYISK